jgi:hypothetical protein
VNKNAGRPAGKTINVISGLRLVISGQRNLS